MRRRLAVIAVAVCCCGLLSACGSSTQVRTVVIKTVTTESSSARSIESTPTPHRARPRSAFKVCDANIVARRGTTTCAFAENVFYEYWANDQAPAIRAYSPATEVTYRVACTPGEGQIACEAGDGADIRFSQRAVDAYSQDQADVFAATHDLGAAEADSPPADPAPEAETASACDPAYEGACVPNDGADYDCAEIDATDFASVGADPDRLDADGDGIACES